MLLKNKVAVIDGAGGAVGCAVATAFAKEGAKVFLAGRTGAKVEGVAHKILADGGVAEPAEVDALDEALIAKHLDETVGKAGGIDISFNATGVPTSVVAERGMQGVPLPDISVESFMLPITTYTRSHFLTGRAAARRMAHAKRSGVILMHTPEPARAGFPSWAEWGQRGRRSKRYAEASRQNSPPSEFDAHASAPPVSQRPRRSKSSSQLMPKFWEFHQTTFGR